MGSTSISPEPRPVDFYVRFILPSTETEGDSSMLTVTLLGDDLKALHNDWRITLTVFHEIRYCYFIAKDV